jgi:prophage regulatory protein
MPRRRKTYGRLLTRKELEARKGITFCPTHLRRLIERGAFPAPIKLGGRKRFWPEEIIDEWIRARVEA